MQRGEYLAPGTWLKHYVCPDKVNPLPMYFYFIGARREEGKEPVPVIQCEWGQKLDVNLEFLRWLERCDAGEVGRIKQNKKIVQPHCEVVFPPKEAEAKPKALAAVAGVSEDGRDRDCRVWPRLFRGNPDGTTD